MPADDNYELVEQPRYTQALAKREAKDLKAIRAAEAAIAASPHKPDPSLYKMLPAIDTIGSSEPVGLMVVVRRVQIKASGFIVKYTVRESGRQVVLEDLDLPFAYRISSFQPEAE
jgi:hypothetical protein